MTVWAAVAAILLGLGTVVGLYGYGQVKEAEERVNSASRAVERASLAATSAEAAVSRIQTVETQVVEPAKERMRQLDLSISNALNDVQHYFEKIEDFEETSVIGEPPEFPPVEYVQRMEEADVVIVIAMRIGAAQQSKTVSGEPPQGDWPRSLSNWASTGTTSKTTAERSRAFKEQLLLNLRGRLISG